MKTVVTIILVIIIIASYSVLTGRKQVKINKENNKLLTIENYELIRNSPYADELSNFTIRREVDEIRFSKNGDYTLFFLALETNNKVRLVGLDGYGIRDKEFLNYTVNLIRKIIEKNSEMSLQKKNE